jgi:hypothetical protein
MDKLKPNKPKPNKPQNQPTRRTFDDDKKKPEMPIVPTMDDTIAQKEDGKTELAQKADDSEEGEMSYTSSEIPKGKTISEASENDVPYDETPNKRPQEEKDGHALKASVSQQEEDARRFERANQATF